MPTFTITMDIKEDGASLPGFPVTKSVTATESGGKATVSRPDSASFTELPLTDLGGVSILYIEADQAYSLRFEDQSDAGLPMAANGVCLLVNSNISSGATNKAALQTNTGSAATVQVVKAGS